MDKTQDISILLIKFLGYFRILSSQCLTTMSQDTPLPPSPDAPSEHCVEASALDVAIDAMLLNPSFFANGKYSDDWGTTDTEEALVLSSVDDARLKDCISAALASIWGIPTMRPRQLEACFCLLRPDGPNSLVVVHQTGGGRLRCMERDTCI